MLCIFRQLRPRFHRVLPPLALSLGLIIDPTTAALASSVGTSLGFTSRAVSLGGAMAAAGRDSASAHQNPASLSSSIAPARSAKESSLNVHWSLLYLNPEMKPINNVVVENEYTSDVTNPRTDQVDTEYPDTFGQSLGLSYQFRESPRHFSFGFVTFLPITNLALVDTGETYIPEYVLHRSRNQKPEFNLAFGMRLQPFWSIGAGVHLGTSLNANTTVFLQNDQTKVSTMRVTAGLKTKAAPYLGTEVHASDSLRLGLVARLPLRQRARIRVNAAGRALGNLAAIDFNYEALATLFYDPLTIELGSAYAFSPRNTLLLQVDYQAWSGFEAPQLEIQQPSTTDCTGAGCGGGVNFAGSRTPAHPLRDIFIPRLGFEHLLTDSLQLRLGYSFKPGIYQNLPGGAGNPLDPDEHRLSLGVGQSFKKFLEFDTPCRIDLHGSFHPLIGERVEKTSGNEAGAGSGDRKIGAPGYETGGHSWGGGVSLAVAL